MGGIIVFGTSNLFRPANILKLILGKLKFSINIGSNKEIGEYIHVQEFYVEQLKLLVEEVGFKIKEIKYSYFGLHFIHPKLTFKDYPTSDIGKRMCQYITVIAQKEII